MHSVSIKRPKSARKLKMSDDSEEETPLGIRAPIVGYEVVDKREKFTVYKIQVKAQGNSWFVFRRYTDFVRLNDKLQDAFPGFHLKLPSKRLFKNNFDPDFIEERAHGLQFFINNIMRHTSICRSSILKEFLCLDDPPGPFDSLEESRAYCQQLEDEMEDMKERMMEMQSELSATKSQLAQARVQQESLVQCLKEERSSNSLQKEGTGDLPTFKSLSHHDEKVEDDSGNTWSENVTIAPHAKTINRVKPLARRRILTSTPDKNSDNKRLETDEDLTKLTQDIEKDDGLNTTSDDGDTTLNSSASTVKDSEEISETSNSVKEQDAEEYSVDVSDDQIADIHNGDRSKSQQSSKRDSGIVADTGLSPLST